MDLLTKKDINNRVLCDFTAALAKSFEMIAGTHAERLAFKSGRQIGRRCVTESNPETRVDKLMDTFGRIFDPAQFGWKIVKFEIDTQTGSAQVYVDADTEAMRRSLERFRFGAQKSITSLIHGFLVGSVEKVIGRKCVLLFEQRGC